MNDQTNTSRCALAAGSISGGESEICPDCRGLCGEANEAVTVFYPCKTCGGTGSVRIIDSRKENKITHAEEKR